MPKTTHGATDVPNDDHNRGRSGGSRRTAKSAEAFNPVRLAVGELLSRHFAPTGRLDGQSRSLVGTKTQGEKTTAAGQHRGAREPLPRHRHLDIENRNLVFGTVRNL